MASCGQGLAQRGGSGCHSCALCRQVKISFLNCLEKTFFISSLLASYPPYLPAVPPLVPNSRGTKSQGVLLAGTERKKSLVRHFRPEAPGPLWSSSGSLDSRDLPASCVLDLHNTSKVITRDSWRGLAGIEVLTRQ